MMGVDDGGASGDIVVVADVPLRHVDQMVVAQTVRCVGHAGKTKIGAVRQDCGQQRRFVRRQIASTQMGEPIGIPGPAIDIAENLGDTHPWQHRVQPDGQIARGIGYRWLGPGYVQRAILDLNTVKVAARRPRHHEVQPVMQRCGTVVQVAGGIGLLIDTDVACGFGGQQVVFEGAVITAARHPDIAAPKSLAQGSEHCRFIQPAVSCAGGKDQLAPFRR